MRVNCLAIQDNISDIAEYDATQVHVQEEEIKKKNRLFRTLRTVKFAIQRHRQYKNQPPEVVTCQTQARQIPVRIWIICLLLFFFF